MSETVEVVGLIGGELVSSAEGSGAREVVLALPLSRLLVRLVRVPSEQTADVAGFLTPLLQEMSPYPDEPLTVGWEVVSESERGLVVLAAALPESSADDVAELLDTNKLRVTRLDAFVLGQLRALWPALAPNGDLGSARRLIVLESASEDRRTTDEDAEGEEASASEAKAAPGALDLIILDGELPSAIRSIPAGADLRREAMLSLLEAEDFGGAKPLAEIVTVAPVDAEALRVAAETQLSAFAPVRAVTPVSVQDSLEALVARSADANALDARPASWREFLDETRFKRKLIRSVSAAVGVWLLAMGVLFGVPMAYNYMADYQKGLSKRHRKAYSDVCEMMKKVEIVQKYSDHTRGALETMRAVSDRLPEGVELESWNFSRENGLSFAGMAETRDEAYDLKDRLTEMADEDGNRVFADVQLGKVSAAKGRQKFSLKCQYEVAEEGE